VLYNVSKIEHEMRRSAWTMHEMARRAEVSVSTVKRTFEVGSAHPATIKRMAEAVGLTIDDVLNEWPDEEYRDPKTRPPRRRRAV
jgi:lambda repressor-like predicted transcriptional regulator